ncbi:alpha- and gamma-adaptin-binding protein p34 [Orussus abietinus]|uniref:alpha- and gamma-adaptin-binding protein p34 n=1 Tax=Orussus abietinus TaxID=222816 RepID=UPI000625730B|nr:alpha- and gamma-adaptin-binding protein p34 [Orussus abietinus]
MDLPRVLIVSSIPGKASEIAQSIGSDRLSVQHETEYYIWNIDNKYYTAKVLLCALQNTSIEVDAENVEALIVYHEPEADKEACDLDQWIPMIASLNEADVHILACSSIPNGVLRDKVVEWCTLRKIELVTLDDAGCNETTDAYDDRDTCGLDRIIEALTAHTWSNMILKDRPSLSQESSVELNRVGDQFRSICLGNGHDSSESLQVDHILDGIMGGDNTDFGELFGQLMAMKERAASLPANQRRVAAEQLVTAFWKAMGGDLSELDGIN